MGTTGRMDQSTDARGHGATTQGATVGFWRDDCTSIFCHSKSDPLTEDHINCVYVQNLHKAFASKTCPCPSLAALPRSNPILLILFEPSLPAAALCPSYCLPLVAHKFMQGKGGGGIMRRRNMHGLVHNTAENISHNLYRN